MKKLFLTLTLLLIGFITIQCKPETEEKLNGNLIVKLVVTSDKDYTATLDGTTVTFSEQLPHGTTEVTIKSLEISNKASVNKSVGDKIPVGSAFTIVVTAENGDTKSYSGTISTKPATTEKDITAIVITANSTDYTGTITGTNIAFPALPFGTTQASIKSLTVAANATADKNVNDVVSITGDSITVTAQDNSTQTYTLSISVSPPSSDKNISAITITTNDTDFTGTIAGTTLTFPELPYGTTLVTLKTLTLSPNATANKSEGDTLGISGENITVTAQDNSTQTYTITLTVGPPYIHIPDTDFRNVILQNSAVTYYDVSGTFIRQDALEKITTIYSSGNITTISGVEYMTALTALQVNSNSLTSADVSTNTSLTFLVLYTSLTALDISSNTSLNILGLDSNSLTALDVSTNTDLTELEVSNNSLTAIDVSTNTSLTELELWNNSLTALDVSTNTELNALYVYSNSLSTLDVSTNTNLTDLYVWNNSLTALDVSTNTSLTFLKIYSNSSLTCIQTASGYTITTVHKDDSQTLTGSCF